MNIKSRKPMPRFPRQQSLIIHRLKCCRNYPCSNCKKRGEAGSCTYVGRGPRGKAQHGRSSPTAVQGRLQHLENLVMSLAQKQGHDSNIDLNAQPGSNDADATPSLGSCDPNTELAPVDTGKLVVKNEGTNYIDSANWLAILDDVGLGRYTSGVVVLTSARTQRLKG